MYGRLPKGTTLNYQVTVWLENVRGVNGGGNGPIVVFNFSKQCHQ